MTDKPSPMPSPRVDPRKPIVEVMARLGQATQLHIDERDRHFQVTDAVTMGVSMILIVLATFNVFHVYVLSQDLDAIVGNMESMLDNLERVDTDMGQVAGNIHSFERSLVHMESIKDHMTNMGAILPLIREDMDLMAASMQLIDTDMQELALAVGSITPKVNHMANHMGVMRHNVRQIARPMGSMNPFLP